MQQFRSDHGTGAAINNPPRTHFSSGRPNFPDGEGSPPDPFTDIGPPMENDPFGSDVNLEDDYIAECILEVIEYEEKRKALFTEKASAAMALYNNEYEFHQTKAEWQSTNRIPKGFMLVEKLTSVLMRYVQRGRKYIQVKSAIPQKQIFMNMARECLLFWLEQDFISFRKNLRHIIKNGLITGSMTMFVGCEKGGMDIMEDLEGLEKSLSDGAELDSDTIGLGLGFLRKIGGGGEAGKPQEDEEEGFLMPSDDQPRLRLKVINFNDFWIDTNNGDRPRYRAWSDGDCVGGFLQEANARGWDPDAVQRALDKVGTPDSRADGHRIRKQHDSENLNTQSGAIGGPLDQQIKYHHFEGTLPSLRDGRWVFEKKYALLANGELMFQPVPLPWWDGAPAIVHRPFIEHPTNDVWGKGILSENVDTIISQVEILNLMQDFFLRSMLGAYVVDKDQLTEHSEDIIEDGLEPGDFVEARKRGTNTPVIEPIPAGDLPPGIWNAVQQFQNSVAEATGLTSELAGMPRTRGRQSAMEQQSRKAEAGSLMEIIFENVEEMIEEVLRLCFLRILQVSSDSYWKTWVLSHMEQILPDSNNPQLRAKWKEEIIEAANWSVQERYKNLGAFFRFTMKIFSNMMERQALVEQMQFFINSLAGIPGAFETMVNLKSVVGQMAEGFGMDKEDVLRAEVMGIPEAGETLVTDSTSAVESPPPPGAGGIGGSPSPTSPLKGGPQNLPGPPSPPPGL